MNGMLPNQQQVKVYIPHEKKKGLKALAFLQVVLSEIVFVAVVLVLLFSTLNYFNILPISTLWPNQLGWLPHKQYSNVAMKQFNNARITPIPPKLSCPSIKEFCENGKSVMKDGKYIGFGDKLSSGSAIFAAFDGDISASSKTVPAVVNGKTEQYSLKTIYLDNKNLGLRAIYYFRGPWASITKSKAVGRGKQIARVGEKTMSDYNNNSLVFSLILGYPATNIPAILNKEQLE